MADWGIGNDAAGGVTMLRHMDAGRQDPEAQPLICITVGAVKRACGGLKASEKVRK